MTRTATHHDVLVFLYSNRHKRTRPIGLVVSCKMFTF
jgi:hypothetical protein